MINKELLRSNSKSPSILAVIGVFLITPFSASVGLAQSSNSISPAPTNFGGNQTIILPLIPPASTRKSDIETADTINRYLKIVFGNDEAAQRNLQNSAIASAISKLKNMDERDQMDYKNPKGRFASAYFTLMRAAPGGENQEDKIYDSLENKDGVGTLAPIYLYENEIKGPNGIHLDKGQQLYARVNSALWHAGGNLSEVTPRNIKNFIPKLDAALAALPEFFGVLFRGEGMTENELLNARESKIVIRPSYTSTTLDIGDAFNFAISNQAPKIRVLMIILGKGYLTAFSEEYMMEEEILIPRNTQFEVVRFDNQVKEYPGWVFLYLRQKGVSGFRIQP